jgi:hypothetical protein
MPKPPSSLTGFLERVPPSDEVRRQLAENLRQTKLLRQVLRIAEQRECVQEVAAGAKQQESPPCQ